MKGKLYLIPNTLGDSKFNDVMPPAVAEVLTGLVYIIVENEKTARRYIKRFLPEKNQSELVLDVLDKHTDPLDMPGFLKPIESGHNVGIISEAGVPCVADPGADIVNIAHRKGIEVIPMVGPSSLLLALMGSGFNGQQFTFRGYLPFDRTHRKKVLHTMEREAGQGVTQLFMETPYRNEKLMEELIGSLHPNTRLCVATDLTLPTQYIKTQSIANWNGNIPRINKRPTIFLID